ncbi:hypothetical protein Ddye_012212 [Dipteronia dyeriana]|uniref:Reverse transcriptase domain-containing protein n=1 Tax=Dipteronia dyeriana TaxID=168575 RepID=A0AAD9X429_9ROSI|nr:hypothetical protein Ddye_012212 [Dipteronia dyeriana]
MKMINKGCGVKSDAVTKGDMVSSPKAGSSYVEVVRVFYGLSERKIQSSVRYLRDKNTLWLFNSISDRDIFICSRLLWKDYFSSVGWAIGEPLFITDETLHRFSLLRGKVLVLIPYSHRYLDKIKVVTEKISFSVTIRKYLVPMSEEWVSRRLWTGNNKAPCPDGLHLNLVKKNWDWINDDFMNFMHTFYKDSSVVKDQNCTFIALIPKMKCPVNLKEYKPISLVGSLYKVMAKVLANIFKLVMNSVIHRSKMAFVKDHHIFDSFVIAEKVIHHWKKEGKVGLLVKLDFKKVYDSVDHVFLIEVLNMMGFGEKWKEWIKWCVSSPFLSAWLNRSPAKQFPIERGLRQGDPLSPFLFNMVTEILSGMFDQVKELELVRGAVFSNSGVHISHLQFIDDTILVLEPKLEYLLNEKRILRCFKLVSGVKINFYKSCLVRVSKKWSSEENWETAFRCVLESLPVTFVSLPLGEIPAEKLFGI